MSKRYTDDNGFLHLEGTPISRVQVAPYLGKQIDAKGKLKDGDGKPLLDPDGIYLVFRGPDELFDTKTVKSFENMPFRVGHQMLGVGGKNVKSVDSAPIDGAISHIRRDPDKPDFLLADIVIYTDRAKNAIRRGTKELSIGYRCAYELSSGEHEGQKYQFRQTNIRANHLALVPHGRAGSSVCVQDESIVGDDGLVITCDSLPEELQIMEEKEKKAKDRLVALLKSSEENVQDCLDFCELSAEQKKAVKAMKAADNPKSVAEDRACKGCGKDEIPAPVPPPAVEKPTDAEHAPQDTASAKPAETDAAPAEGKPAEADAASAQPQPSAIKPPAVAPAEDASCPKCGKTFTQDELDDACRKAAKNARRDAIRAKQLAEVVGEDASPDDTEADVARKACRKIKGLEQYASDERPDGEVLAAIRGHIAQLANEPDEKKPETPKKKIVSVAQDEAVAKPRSTFSMTEFQKYLGEN